MLVWTPTAVSLLSTGDTRAAFNHSVENLPAGNGAGVFANDTLAPLLVSGAVPMAMADAALTNLFKVQLRLGMFDTTESLLAKVSAVSPARTAVNSLCSSPPVLLPVPTGVGCPLYLCNICPPATVPPPRTWVWRTQLCSAACLGHEIIIT